MIYVGYEVGRLRAGGAFSGEIMSSDCALVCRYIFCLEAFCVVGVSVVVPGS